MIESTSIIGERQGNPCRMMCGGFPSHLNGVGVVADKHQSRGRAGGLGEKSPFGPNSNMTDRWNGGLGTNIKCWNLIILNSLAMSVLSLPPRTQPALCPLPGVGNCSGGGRVATGTMLCAVIAAGASFACVFAFSLVIVWDRGTKNKSCNISFEKSAFNLWLSVDWKLLLRFLPSWERFSWTCLFTKENPPKSIKVAPVKQEWYEMAVQGQSSPGIPNRQGWKGLFPRVQKCLYYPFMLNIITEHSGVLFKGLKVTFTVVPKAVGFPQPGLLGTGGLPGYPQPSCLWIYCCLFKIWSRIPSVPAMISGITPVGSNHFSLLKWLTCFSSSFFQEIYV